jgi:hypothetical protein
MSKNSYIGFGDSGFWAYDVSVHIFLKHLIDCACEYVESHDCPWLRDYIQHWRVQAVVNDLGMSLDNGWTEQQRQTVRVLIEEACGALQRRDSIPAEEVASWQILDDLRIFCRGATLIPTAPVVELGRAIASLVEGTLPCPPQGTYWYYGADCGRLAIERKT